MFTVAGSTTRVTKDRPATRCNETAELLGISLIELFDVADFTTRKTILTLVPKLPSAEERREILLRGLRHGGNREAVFVSALAAMIALQLGDEGKSVLWHAMSQHMVRDERTRTTILAALQPRS